MLYRLPLEGEDRRAAQRRGEFDLGSQVTAADLSPDGNRLVVLSYEYICVFERPGDSDQFFAGRHHRVLIEGRQCEGISFDRERIVFTNEQREMYCLPLDDLLARETYLPAIPHVDVPRWTPEDTDVFTSGCRVPLHLGAGMPDADPGTATPPTLNLAWSPDALHVSVRWSSLEPPGKGSRQLMQLMLGPPGDEPRLGPDQGVWEVQETLAGVRMRRERPNPKGDWLQLESRREGSQLEFHARIPAPAQPQAELGFNAIAFVPRSPLEWCWSTSSSAQPERNPVLWGRLRLVP